MDGNATCRELASQATARSQKSLGFSDLVPNGVPYRTRRVMDAEFIHQPVAISRRGLKRHPQHRGNLFGTVTGSVLQTAAHAGAWNLPEPQPGAPKWW